MNTLRRICVSILVMIVFAVLTVIAFSSRGGAR